MKGTPFDFDQVFQAVAEKEGVSVETVRGEIASAIREAMAGAGPEAQAHFAAMAPGGEPPTPEEALRYLLSMMASGGHL